MDFVTPVVNVLYGSETGTAEDVAEKVCVHLERAGQAARMDALDDIDFSQLADSPLPVTAVFVVSTTGDGVAPSNMRTFWNYIRQRSLPAHKLRHVHFAIFGLGDSSYEHYNAAARRLRKRLLQLGAIELFLIGLGDDQSGLGYLGGLDPWLQQLLTVMSPGKLMESAPMLGPEEYHVQLDETSDDSEGTQPCFDHMQGFFGVEMIGPFEATVLSNERLTAPSWPQTVCNVRLRYLEGQSSVHRPGDVAVVHPKNPAPLVGRAAAAFGVSIGALYSIRRRGRFGERRRGRVGSLLCTGEVLLSNYLDIADDEEEKEKLLELSSAVGTDLYFDYCLRERRSFVDVMEEFTSCHGRVPLARLLEVVSVLKPRQYSIASAPTERVGQVDLCVALLEETTPYKRTRPGTASSFLCALKESEIVYMWVKPNELFPGETILTAPLLLVGPGTGVAPMRALLREKIRQQKSAAKDTLNFGHAMLFFGCRKRLSDYLYEQEWRELFGVESTEGDVLRTEDNYFFAAFSRDRIYLPSNVATPGGGRYVTHLLEEHGRDVWNNILSREDCIIYIAGAAKRMPADVRNSLKAILIRHGGCPSDIEAESFFRNLERRNRVILDVWS